MVPRNAPVPKHHDLALMVAEPHQVPFGGSPAFADLQSDRLPPLPGQIWAAEVRHALGERLVYLINYRPEQGWVRAFLFDPVRNRLHKLWEVATLGANRRAAIIVVAEEVLVLSFDHPWLIINGQTTRLRRMPRANEPAITIPSYQTQIGFILDDEGGLLGELCCVACCAVHCALLVPCSLDELCCNRTCGPPCFCDFACCFARAPRCF